MHNREVETIDGHAEVMNGHRCVAIVTTRRATGPDGSIILDSDQARRLSRILEQQADAADRDDETDEPDHCTHHPDYPLTIAGNCSSCGRSIRR